MPTPIPISDAFRMYREDYIVMSNLSPKTEESYDNTCVLLVRFLGDVDLCTLGFNDVRNWRNWLLTWQRQDTARGNIICLRMVLRFLRKRGYGVMDYENIPVSKREKRTFKWLNEEEIDRFVFEAGKPRRGYNKLNRLRNVAIIQTLRSTGLRVGELCALNRDSIKDRTFTVIGKSKEPRIGFINERAETAINAYLDARTDSNKALFISHQTEARLTEKMVQFIFRNICEKSDFVGVTPHTMRHSYATHLLSKDVNLRYVGDLMGHVSLDTTKVYTHYSNPQLRAVYEKANESA